jgi:hypothetical protein
VTATNPNDPNDDELEAGTIRTTVDPNDEKPEPEEPDAKPKKEPKGK